MDKISMQFWTIHSNMMGWLNYRDYGIINVSPYTLSNQDNDTYFGLDSRKHFDVEHEYSHKTLRALIEKLEYPQVFSWWNDGRME